MDSPTPAGSGEGSAGEGPATPADIVAAVDKRRRLFRFLPEWRPGSRRERLHASRSYGYILSLVLVSFAFVAVAPDESWANGIIVLIDAGIFILALWTSGVHADPPTLLALALLGIAVALGQVAIGGHVATGIAGLADALFLIGACAAIAVGVFDQGEVNRQSVVGAVSIYLMLGMVFTFIYGAVAALGSTNLFAQGTNATRSIRLYFSYVTLATLGYGDYTPANALGRLLAVIEALLGQLYLVTVVAILVGNIGRGRDH